MFTVVRTTTDKLEATLNAETLRPGLSVRNIEWIGGRDWVIICDVGLAALGQSRGWVDDQEQRHARLRAELAANGPLPEDITPSHFVNRVDPEVEWGGIRYGRYDETLVPKHWTGWIEDHARSWIIFLGPHGAPSLYWPRRDENGGVIGKPINLAA